MPTVWPGLRGAGGSGGDFSSDEASCEVDEVSMLSLSVTGNGMRGRKTRPPELVGELEKAPGRVEDTEVRVTLESRETLVEIGELVTLDVLVVLNVVANDPE
jgi:hypothetical protein